MPPVPAAAPSQDRARPTTVDGRITAPVLVGAGWLARHRDSVAVLDTRPAHEFDAGHVPGSASLPLDSLLVDDSSRAALARLAIVAREALALRGIHPDDHVVLLDGCDGSAALGATICELAGLRRVSVLQGSGIDEWLAIGGALEDGSMPVAPVDQAAWLDVAQRNSAVAPFEELVDAVVEGSAIVLDARSQLEHEGIVGAPCCSGRGAIPGSVHLEWTSCFDMFGAPRDREHVVGLLAQVGIGPDDQLIVTCHAGHRAAIAARVLRSVGLRNVRVSLGSWHEWAARGLGSEGDAHPVPG